MAESNFTVGATVVSSSGDPVEVDTSAAATARFGFRAGEGVRFTKSRHNGRTAVVRGVCRDGLLWFSFEPDGPAQTTSCRGREELLRQYGLVSESE